jgi:hypothetical protein
MPPWSSMLNSMPSAAVTFNSSVNTFSGLFWR